MGLSFQGSWLSWLSWLSLRLECININSIMCFINRHLIYSIQIYIYIYTYIYCVHTDSHDHVTLVGGLKVIGSCGVSEYAKLDQSKA